MSSFRRGIAAVLGTALAVAGLSTLAQPAMANTTGTDLVISEVYGAGGNGGAIYNADFVELYNPTSSPIKLNDAAKSYWLAYNAVGGNPGGSPVALTGTVPANSHWLVQVSAVGSNGIAVTADEVFVTGSQLSLGAAGGRVTLQTVATPISVTGNTTATANIIDVVSQSGSSAYETAVATTGVAASTTTSLQRKADLTNPTRVYQDTDNTLNDIVSATPTPTNSGQEPEEPEEPGDPVEATIAEIQGTGPTSPLVNQIVITTGVVTAVYNNTPNGFGGFYIQTGGTGGPVDATPGASDAVFAYGPASANSVEIGDSVQVQGKVEEFAGTTELTGLTVTQLDTPLAPVTALSVPWSELSTDALKEAHEGELIAPGDFVVTNAYGPDGSGNWYGSIGLAAGDTPLLQPTDVADPHDLPAIAAVVADNAARAINLDDGTSRNYRSGANTAEPLPWWGAENPPRVKSAVTFTDGVILEWRNSMWNFQPTSPMIGALADGTHVATFEDTRELAPGEVGGDIKLATFNVLNYFPTTGAAWVSSGSGTCTFYNDREGNPITNNTCSNNGPRGAANAENLERQAAKIVLAINSLDASVVSLEEIENSAKYGQDRDWAVADLVTRLNAAAGAGTWDYVPSPTTLPALGDEDVIRTAFIYKPAEVEYVEDSTRILIGSPAFGNAREPLAAAFKAIGAPDSDSFIAIVNHFKSKGSGVDDGTGQGNANPDRINQAIALSAFADDVADDFDNSGAIFLLGDFNSYTMEDPLQVLYDDGYTNLESTVEPGEATYSFQGLYGSLDHVLANDIAYEMVTGVDVWNINAEESVAFQYSRWNLNILPLVDITTPFAASDHSPEIVGIDLPDVHTGPTFIDVPEGAPFYEEIEWAAANGIVEGYPDGTFRPSASINRDAVAALLFRAENPGEPKPVCAPGESPFTDVPSSHQFCGEIAWMKAEGISTGNANGTYSPNDPVSRQAIAAFLARAWATGPLPACNPSLFIDVPANNPFCKEITWMKQEGITNGWSTPAGTQYRPIAPIERQAFVAFLYRHANPPAA